MKTYFWKLALLLVLVGSLVLYAAIQSKDVTDDVPPGIPVDQWHAISADFGFVLRPTQAPVFSQMQRQGDNENEQVIPDNATEEEKQEIWKKQLDGVTKDMLGPGSGDVQQLRLGHAEAVFLARHHDMWYVIANPVPPLDVHFIGR